MACLQTVASPQMHAKVHFYKERLTRTQLHPLLKVWLMLRCRFLFLFLCFCFLMPVAGLSECEQMEGRLYNPKYVRQLFRLLTTKVCRHPPPPMNYLHRLLDFI